MASITEAPAEARRSRKEKPEAAVPTQRPTKRRRRPALIGLGLALIGLGALSMVFLTQTVGQTYQVLAVSGEVARGETIEAADLVAVDLPSGPTALEPVAATELDAYVGQTATADLLPGSLLTASAATTALGPSDGSSVVGVALPPSRMPAQPLHAGDHVRIVDTPVEGGDPPSDEPGAITATVLSTRASDLSDLVIVDVEVSSTMATGLAARVATGRIALILDPAEG